MDGYILIGYLVIGFSCRCCCSDFHGNCCNQADQGEEEETNEVDGEEEKPENEAAESDEGAATTNAETDSTEQTKHNSDRGAGNPCNVAGIHILPETCGIGDGGSDGAAKHGNAKDKEDGGADPWSKEEQKSQ